LPAPQKKMMKTNNMPKDMSKTYNRKDWNCPWMTKDGRGMKQAMRCVEDPSSNTRTSTQHYYSEPRSILSSDPVLSPEQIQELIRQHGGDSRPQSAMQQNGSRPTSAMQRNGGNPYETEMEAEIQEEFIRREDRNNIEVREQATFEEERYNNQLVNTMLEQELNQMRIEQQRNIENSCYSEREVDSQAPPDLEPVTPRNNSMTGGDETYEPSADELIDVLKNLENLAAANPALYRSIVGQIKVSQHDEDRAYYENQQFQQQQQQQQQFMQESNFYAQETESRHLDQAYEQQQQLIEQMYQEQMNQMNNSEQYHEQVMHQEEQFQKQESSFQSQEASYQRQEVVKEVAIQESEEEKARRLKMERLEREANEQVAEVLNKQREIKMAKLHPPEPPKPKEIKVIAGDGKTVTITLGAEKVDEENRKQVAEAAGLKHIPLPDFDDSNSAWSGSLRKTDRSKHVHNNEEENPSWSGSLRHVKPTPNKKKNRKDEDDHGNAPWMGTLRHVVHDNKVTKNYGVNQHQSKRYPDEDAGNPFEAQGGSCSRPAFPLTPAAVSNGIANTRTEIADREDKEELDRIRGNLGNMKASETVSSALLKALMPKLLKAHESKYEAIDRDEASRIMEEILAMQVGLNVDQQADANEEAEMMIRAIMQEEVGGAVYARMADDLEAARASRKKKKATKKKAGKKMAEQKSAVSA